MSDIIERAREIRAKIESVANTLEDEAALDYVELFPAWNPNGIVYAVGDRVRYQNDLYKALQDHVSQTGWNPVDAPSLFAKILIPDPDVIPVWEQPDSTNPYMTGDRVHYPDADGPVYESLIDNNTWSPEAYPAGWQEITNEE